MESLLTRLANTEHFTKGEQKIASFIIKKPSEVLETTTEQLGKLTQTSGAAVVRFAKKLGYQGFPSLKLDLASEAITTNDADMNEIKKGESIGDIFNKMGTRFKLIPEVVQERNNSEVILDIVKHMEHAKRIFVYGIAASGLVAQDLQQKLTRIGLLVIFNSDFHQMITAVQALGQPGDLSFGISESGRTPEILRFQKISHDKNMITVGITSAKKSGLSQVSDLNLYSFTQTFNMTRSASTIGIASQLYLIDILFYAYLSENYDTGIEHILETRERVDRELHGMI
ncbi:MAG: MurR/RpiR family transcriptional regulator [Leuconostoc pseudomesenteroides]|uniref:MurR/RpiR family transcriptional regulator n=1 Tax=Leuconostoc pseudomesenteroides TaxID=33968 RepID=UPI0039ED9AA3